MSTGPRSRRRGRVPRRDAPTVFDRCWLYVGQSLDTTLHLLAQQQQQLDGQRERAVERLGGARRELQHLHWWNRGERAELETEIALQCSVLERVDEKQEKLRQLAQRRSRLLARERQELAPSLRPDPPRPHLEREPPGLGLEI